MQRFVANKQRHIQARSFTYRREIDSKTIELVPRMSGRGVPTISM